jgi:hypothetical protein
MIEDQAEYPGISGNGGYKSNLTENFPHTGVLPLNSQIRSMIRMITTISSSTHAKLMEAFDKRMR